MTLTSGMAVASLSAPGRRESRQWRRPAGFRFPRVRPDRAASSSSSSAIRSTSSRARLPVPQSALPHRPARISTRRFRRRFGGFEASSRYPGPRPDAPWPVPAGSCHLFRQFDEDLRRGRKSGQPNALMSFAGALTATSLPSLGIRALPCEGSIRPLSSPCLIKPPDRPKIRNLANAIRACPWTRWRMPNRAIPACRWAWPMSPRCCFRRFLKFDPADPAWPDRDRFVLSAGHGSMLLYPCSG